MTSGPAARTLTPLRQLPPVTNPTPWLLRLPAQIVIWTLLAIAALGPRSHVSVCTGDACCEAGAAMEAAGCCCNCGCCNSDCDEAPEDADQGTPPGEQNRGVTCTGCRLDLSLPIEVGPVPSPFETPAELTCAGLAVPVRGPEGRDEDPSVWPYETGPPRPDPRTNLIVTTILRR